MDPLLAFEYLFFAIFGQTTHSELKVETSQPEWTSSLFKLVFGAYMLVSVVVLINLLIAMMSDTYQRIQAQSDIEWKYGLSKLIRNMHRNTSAPSPLNLITSWLVYFIHMCQQKTKVKRPPTLAGMMGMAGISGHMSPRSKMGQKWLSKVKKGALLQPKESITTHSNIHLSPLGSQLSFAGTQRIETVVDWELVRKKYMALFNNEPDSNVERDNKDMEENETFASAPGANALI